MAKMEITAGVAKIWTPDTLEPVTPGLQDHHLPQLIYRARGRGFSDADKPWYPFSRVSTRPNVPWNPYEGSQAITITAKDDTRPI